MLATVPAAKHASAITPSNTPEPMATRMSRPVVPAVLTLPVRTFAPDRVVRAARTFCSGGLGGVSREAATADAAAVAGDASRGATSAGSNSGSSGGSCSEIGSGS